MNTATHSNKAMKGQDLGPLAWVLAEMRQTYSQAIESLQGFASRVSDPEQTNLSDDTSEIAKAKNLIHQTCGALEMVGAFIPAFVLRQCEHVVSAMAQRPQTCTPQAVATLAQTGSVVGEYLESLLQDPTLSPVLLFPTYKNAHALTGMQPPASPADLWHLEGDLREPELPLPNKAIVPNARVRALLDRSILHLMQGKAVERSGKDLVKLCLGLAAGNQDFRERTFWKVAAGFFEGLAQQRIPNDLYVKRAATRVLVQYASLDKGDIHITARWMQDLLFFCSQARDITPASSPVLTAVRTAFGLERTPIVDYETNVFNRLRETDRKALLEDLKAAAESWGSIVEGHVENAASTAAQLHHTGAVLVRHFPETAPLIQTLKQIIDTLAKKHAKPPTELAMEVATTILYLQAMLEDIRTRTAQLSERMSELNKRLRTVAEHGESLPLPEWMEELYTRVRDNETITSVVSELRASLTEVESHIDRFFRNHADIDALRDAPSILLRVRGVLAVLGMVPATKAITQINLDIQEIIQQHEQGELNETDGRFEKIGNNLGALGLQVDMLAYQPSLARELFVFDNKTSQLQPLMGRLKVYEIGGRDIFEHVQEAAVTPAEPDPRYADNGETTPMVFDPTAPMPLPETPSAQPEAQALTQDLIFNEDSADAQDEATEAEKPEQEAPAALEEEKAASIVADENVPAPQPQSAAMTDEGELLDEELLEIFLEEAREVICNGRDALTHLAQSPSDVPQQTILRRAFHTLKGSSRMVGLAAFGEAAWAMEQLMNSWLAEQKAFHPSIHDLCQESLNALQQWVDAIAAHAPVAWQPEAFQQSAEAMRTQDRYVPLQVPTETAPAIEAPQATQPDDVSPGVPSDSAAPDFPDTTLSQKEQALAGETDTPSLVLDEAFDVSELEATPDQTPEEIQEPEALVTAEEATASKEAETIALAEDITVEDEDEELADIEFSHSDLVRFSELDQAHEGLPTDFSSVLIEPLEAHAPAADQSQPLSQDWKELDFLAADQQEPPPAPEETPKDLIATESLLGEIDDSIRSSIMGSLPSKDDSPAVAQASEPSPEPSDEAAESDFLHSSLFDRDSELEKTRVMEDHELYDDLMGETRVMETAVFPPDDSLLMGLDSLPALELPSLTSTQPAAPAQETAPQPDVVQSAQEPEPEPEPEQEQEQEQEQVSILQEEADLPAHLGDFSLRGKIGKNIEQIAQELESGHDKHTQWLLQALQFTQDLEKDLASWFTQRSSQPLPERMVERSQQLASTGEHIKADASFGQFLAQLAQHIQQLSNQPAAQPEQVRRVITDSLQEIQSALDGIVASTGYGQIGRNEFDRLATLQAALPSASQPPAPSAETLAIMGQIDPDLFPIFEEEAIELLPRLIGGLRRWASEPQSFEARSEVLRVLHTLKGSSRLAGARQIGEMAHRFESDIEALEAKADNAQHIPPLFARYDELQSAFDALRSAATEVESSLASAEGPATQFDLAEAAAQAEATGSEQATPHTPASAAPTPASATPGPSSSGASLPHTPQIGASFGTDLPGPTPLVVQQSSRRIQTVRVRSTHINRLINQAGEIQISRSRAESRLRQLNTALDGMTVDLDRLRHQLRELEVQTESQMQSRMTLGKDSADFDPLELDRFTRVQELTRMMAETVNDVATVQRTLQAAMIGTEDDLVAQERKGRELQRDLLHTRMVEFDSVAERLHAVVRQAATDTGKMADLVIENGNIEMDRVLLDRLMGGFEHLLRNCVGHGIEPPAEREQAGKPATGIITLTVEQEGNDVAISFSDDGAGLNLEAIRNKGIERGLITADQEVTTKDLSNLIFMPGFTTAQELTGVSGRGIGMDVVRVDVSSLGGRIETTTEKGKGTTFRMVMPLTTAVTQVMLVRAGTLIVGLPANLIDGIERVSHDVLLGAYDSGVVEMEGKRIPFYWAGAMLQHSQRSQELAARTYPVVLVRSAAQIVAVHVDEVLGNQEVVVKNLGPQLSTLPGLTGMSVLASGAVLLVYNFIALASVYGASAQALQRQRDPADIPADIKLSGVTRDSDIPLVMVVDDSITVRRVTERMLKREGYRVVLAANGAVALEMLQQAQELPVVILSDIEMPQMDGFELLTHVRADARLASLPVVMITSRMAQKHRDHAMQLGANHYLGKPYSDAELLALVRQYANAVQAEA